MDTESILNGVRQFYEVILPKAFYLSNWSDPNLIQAFSWAKYCEEVHSKCAKEDVNHLDALLHSVSNELKNYYPVQLCYHDLKNSSTRLIQAFFENPNVENSDIERIVNHVQSNENFYSEKVCTLNILDNLCLDLFEKLKPLSRNNSEISFHHEIKSEVYLVYLKNNLKHKKTEDHESYLSSAFEKMWETEDNKIVFCHLLLLSAEQEDEEVSEIQSFGLSWMLLKVYSDESCRLAKFLLNQPLSRLRLLAEKHKPFYEFYMEAIIRSAECLQKTSNAYHSSEKRLLSVNLSFNQVLNHLHSLLKVDDDLAVSTRRYLTLVSQSDESVWKEISSKLNLDSLKTDSFC